MSFGLLKRRFIGSPRRVDIEDTAYWIVKLVNFYDLLVNWVTQHARAWLSTWWIPHALEIYLLSPQGVLVIFNLHIYYYYFLERKNWLWATTTATTEPADYRYFFLEPSWVRVSSKRFSGGFKNITKREISRQPQNYIAIISTGYCHLLTCIYAVLAHDKDHILKLRTLALFLKRINSGENNYILVFEFFEHLFGF